MTPPRHPVTGRFLAFDCEVDCLEHCAGLCGNMAIPAVDRIEQLTSVTAWFDRMTPPAEGDDK